MKTRRLLLLVLATIASAVPAAAAAAKGAARPPGPPPLAPRFQQVRDRIDALYQHRQEPPPPPDPRANPFRAPGSLLVGLQADGTPAPSSPTTDLALLQQAVAPLKVSGIFEIAGEYHLVINARPYKKGDVIQAQVQAQPVYLRVREVSRHAVTLAVNESEMTLKF